MEATHPDRIYVATHLLEGRSLFAILADRFVTDRVDEHPFLLDELSRDPVLRGSSPPRRTAASSSPGEGGRMRLPRSPSAVAAAACAWCGDGVSGKGPGSPERRDPEDASGPAARVAGP